MIAIDDAGLTPVELQAVLAAGTSTDDQKRLARRVGMTDDGFRQALSRAYRKLRVGSRLELWAAMNGRAS